VGLKIGVPLGLLACVLMYGSLSTGQSNRHDSKNISESCEAIGWIRTADPSCIIVFVNDGAGLDRSTLRRAEAEATRLLRPSGIQIRWRNCAETRDCRRPPRSKEFVLHIVPQGTVRSDMVFGEAFLGPDGNGKYADVFFDRLRNVKGINIAQLLGAVAAHELGHLLLGSHAHSLIGIMEPSWDAQSLRRISMGDLTFTPEQLRSIRNRLVREEPPVSFASGWEHWGLREDTTDSPTLEPSLERSPVRQQCRHCTAASTRARCVACGAL
jgi:hypothetical protein